MMNDYNKYVLQYQKKLYANSHQIHLVLKVKKYLDLQYNEPIDLEVLAKVGLTSKYHLLRTFKRYYGLTPKQYLIYKRIEQAKRLLRQSNSVQTVCHQVGFESISSFSGLFKRKTGKTPLQYQKEQLSKRQKDKI